MDRLPVEIWLLITEFFSDEELYHVIGVNRFFYNLGLDSKYRRFVLDGGHHKTLARNFERISEPMIAQRVKQFTVSLFEIDVAVPSQDKGVHGGALASLHHVMNMTIGIFTGDSSTANHGTKTMLASLMDVLPSMVNVEDFRISTWAFPSNESLDSFYQLAWSVFGRNLRSLAISATLDGCHNLSRSVSSFPSLRNLEISFADPAGHPTGGQSPAEFAPFINSLAGQLESLKIRSFSTLDFSSLFLNLQPLPHLESLLIRIPFNHGLIEDPSALGNFLIRSTATLRNLDIRLAPTGLALTPMGEAGLQDFLGECLSNPLCLSNVTCLDIYPTNLPGAVEVLRKAIRNSSRHLTDLTVRDRYLKVEELLEFSKELGTCTQLTRLRLNVNYLSCDIFDALARDAPGLRRLWLSVGDAAPGSTPIATLETVRNSMKNRSYPNWKLWDLTIYQGGNELDDSTILACARSIPSVKSLWGRGYMMDLDSKLDYVGFTSWI